MNHIDKNIEGLKQAAEYILAGKTDEAKSVINKDLPFVPIKKESRSYSMAK